MTEENGGRRIVDFGLWNADCGLKKDERREMKKTENPVERGKSEKGEAAPQAIAAMIRESRETGQLLSEDEIYRRVVDEQLLLSSGADSAEEVGTLLRKLVDESEDLQGMAAQDVSRSYYSSHFMTEAYARIDPEEERPPARHRGDRPAELRLLPPPRAAEYFHAAPL